ncbi:CbtA family protein [Halocatena pleomorpha]|uniref:CbtA family protein n=1 Tax=Halocatena pleomorpha TaxID=1785090 RepID=A0A3P3RK45_9EURY|nr:CbtA family protein [Halocatena pleomorpha]RRJ33704.1 hypothetical protein EIK79_02610 [Halocatena pleomorpha]
MFTEYVTRGAKAGVVGGVAFGLFIALVGNPLIGYAETFEHSHGHSSTVSDTVAAVVSVVGGVLLGVLLGIVVFGAIYYFLEPVLPGGSMDAESYLLGGAGFITISGAPWLALPPQPPGVEQSLSVDVRIAWYALMMGAGALSCGLAGYVYRRLRRRFDDRSRAIAAFGATTMFGVLPVVALVAPANSVTGPIPSELATVIRAVTAMGQVGFWFVLATAHAWLVRRDRSIPESETDPIDAPSMAVEP